MSASRVLRAAGALLLALALPVFWAYMTAGMAFGVKWGTLWATLGAWLGSSVAFFVATFVYAGDLAGGFFAQQTRERAPWEWALVGVGIAATIGAAWLLARAAHAARRAAAGEQDRARQDLASAVPGVRLSRSVRACKWVELDPVSTLGRAMSAQRVRVNSLHLQGIRQLGRGLRVCGRDAHGVVQAIEDADGDRALVGVQWHPEYLLDSTPQRRLFAWLVAACRRG